MDCEWLEIGFKVVVFLILNSISPVADFTHLQLMLKEHAVEMVQS